MTMTPHSLPDDAGALKALVIAASVENERLIAIIKELRRHRFGPRSEKIDPDQLALMLEDVERIDCRRRGGGGSPRVTEAGQRARCPQAADQSRRAAQGLAARGRGHRPRRQELPVLRGPADQDRRGRIRAARHDPGTLQGHCDRAGPNTPAAPARARWRAQPPSV